jgi:hypothetical protein
MKNNIFSFLSIKRERIYQILSLILVFGLLKLLVYFAPLLLSVVLESEIKFGEFEYSFNLSQTLTGAFSMGLASAYAYFILKKNRLDLKPIFHLHFIVLTALICLIALVFPSLLDNLYFGSIIIAVALADQLLISGILKLSGQNNKSVIIDTGVYIILFVFVLLTYFKIIDFSFRLWFLSILISLVLTCLFYHLKNIKGFKVIISKQFFELYKYAGLILISGPLVVLLSVSTRLYIEWLIDFKSVGLYSLYFRLASFVLIIYRIASILLYRKIFIDEHLKLDKYYSIIISSLFIINILIFYSLPYVLSNFMSNFKYDFTENKTLILCSLFQVTFWINTAVFEAVLQRENLVKHFIFTLLLFGLILAGGLTLINIFNFISLELIVWYNTLIIYLLFFGQQYILMKKGVYYKKSLTVHLIQGAIFIPTIFIIL